MFWHGLTLSEFRASCYLLGAIGLKGMYFLLGSKRKPRFHEATRLLPHRLASFFRGMKELQFINGWQL